MSVINITKENFENEVINSNLPVMLDFYADWCGPCKMLAPVVHEIAEERSDIKVGKVNVDKEPELAAVFNVMSIPVIAVLKEGKVVNSSLGVRPKEKLLAML